MITANKLKELSLLKDDKSEQLSMLIDKFYKTINLAYNEMNEYPHKRTEYRENLLMKIDRECDKSIIIGFAEYVEQYGYVVYDDSLYNMYTVTFDPVICGNPYRKRVLDKK